MFDFEMQPGAEGGREESEPKSNQDGGMVFWGTASTVIKIASPMTADW